MEVGSPIPSQSLSSDFEVPPSSSRKVISSEETVTVNKVDSTDVKADTRPVRITRTKAKVVSSAGGKQKLSSEKKMTRKTRIKIMCCIEK